MLFVFLYFLVALIVFFFVDIEDINDDGVVAGFFIGLFWPLFLVMVICWGTFKALVFARERVREWVKNRFFKGER